MRYIIMAGRGGDENEVPKQLWKAGGEYIIARTIRLLKKYGVTDICISTHDDRFKQFGCKILRHNNPTTYKQPWITAFYPSKEPCCYVMGDVVFSEDAIRIIVETETDSIEFFASAPPFRADYPKKWAEPFAFKVVDLKKFQDSIEVVKQGLKDGKWNRDPIAWELWQVIKGTPWNRIDYTNFTVINDFTCDVDKDLAVQLIFKLFIQFNSIAVHLVTVLFIYTLNRDEKLCFRNRNVPRSALSERVVDSFGSAAGRRELSDN